jgi:hypothetical protein
MSLTRAVTHSLLSQDHMCGHVAGWAGLAGRLAARTTRAIPTQHISMERQGACSDGRVRSGAEE